MVVWLYGINFCIGLLIMLPTYATLRRETGFSREYLKLLDGFDYTVYNDFMHNHGSAVNPLLSVGLWLGVFYLLLSLFFAGGQLLQVSATTDQRQLFRLSRFLAASVQYFGRFFRLFLCVAGFIALAGFVFVCLGALAGLSLSETSDERAVFGVLLICFFLFGTVALLAVCAGDYAKILLFRQDENRAFPAFWQGMRFVVRNFRTAFGSYLLLVGLAAAGFGLYFWIESWLVTSGWAGIAILFVVQQWFVFSRIFLKVWILATAGQRFAEKARFPLLELPRTGWETGGSVR
ncbi:hypothetical protein ACFPMF_14090 [Larkinella bovis]|uniref:DUF898 family protein n=1 Tax=Larkinella bovis TaxID=683041 RepID=A0ABW0IGF9_9BACT